MDFAGMFLTDRIAQEHRSWRGVLGAMLYGLLAKHCQLLPIFAQFAGEEQATTWPLAALERYLIACKLQNIVEFSFCFFVDALDENDTEDTTRDRIVRFLKELVSKEEGGLGSFKVCAASRPDNEFDLRLKRCSGLRVQDWTRKDIQIYVWERLSSHPAVGEDVHNASLHWVQHLCSIILDRAQGVFLWVRLVVDNVCVRLSRGELLRSIERKVQELPNQELPDFFLAIIKNTPKETRADTHAILETVLRAQEPVAVMHIAILLEVIPRGYQQSKYISELDDDDLQELRTCGYALERRIRDATGGLVHVVAPVSSDGDRHSMILNHDPHSDTATAVEPGKWTVQFFHQTVKDFLLTTDTIVRAKIDSVLLHHPHHSPLDLISGHYYILHVLLLYASLESDVHDQLGWHVHPMPISKILMHASELERLKGARTFRFLDHLDGRLTDLCLLKGEHWPELGLSCDPQWKTTFLAYAIGNDMQSYVEETLHRRPSLTKKFGRPLLHYAAWFPGKDPNSNMVKILLQADDTQHWLFDYGYQWGGPGLKSPLDCLEYNRLTYDKHEALVVTFIVALIDNDLDFSSHVILCKSPETWHTLFHQMVSMSLPWERRLELVKHAVLKNENVLNVRDGEGHSVFETLLHQAPNANVRVSQLRRLLRDGAKITANMVRSMYAKETPCESSDSLSTYERVCTMLLEPEFRDRSFYNSEAWLVMVELVDPQTSQLTRIPKIPFIQNLRLPITPWDILASKPISVSNDSCNAKRNERKDEEFMPFCNSPSEIEADLNPTYYQ
jgi:hypothetical protein